MGYVTVRFSRRCERMKVIYEPKGRAKEYADLDGNIDVCMQNVGVQRSIRK